MQNAALRYHVILPAAELAGRMTLHHQPKHAMLALRPRDEPAARRHPHARQPPPQDALWLQDIEEQLISLVRPAEQRWPRLAAWLTKVEAQALGQGTARSDTAWAQTDAAQPLAPTGVGIGVRA